MEFVNEARRQQLPQSDDFIFGIRPTSKERRLSCLGARSLVNYDSRLQDDDRVHVVPAAGTVPY